MNFGRVATTLLLLACFTQHSNGQSVTTVPQIPKFLEAALPAKCLQVVLVLSPSAQSVPARMWLLERASSDEAWQATSGEIAVTLGRNGLAWGDGEYQGEPPSGFRVKREGDGCSPAGVFQIPFAFGYAPKSEASMVRLPYISVTKTVFAVDDSQSRFYNQVVDTLKVSKDWRSAEIMRRDDWLYRWGAYVAHNPRNRAFRGSCISLHIWRGPGEPTAGCTGMTEADMQSVLAWLDPAKEPRLVQAVEGW